MPKVCILDYGLGNIQSLKNALKRIGIENYFYSEKKNINYDLIFIPGIGSYYKASKLVLKKEYIEFLNKKNKSAKIFGICLGMQIFSTYGEEFGKSKGLDFIPGKTLELKNKSNKLILPFVGYHKIKFNNLKNYSFLKEFDNKKFYFVHSYFCDPENLEDVSATSTYGGKEFSSIVNFSNIYGTQFHPEKSHKFGFQLLKGFLNL